MNAQQNTNLTDDELEELIKYRNSLRELSNKLDQLRGHTR